MTILLCSHRSIFSPFSLSGEAGPIIDPTEINGSLPSDPAAVTFFSLLQNLLGLHRADFPNGPFPHARFAE